MFGDRTPSKATGTEAESGPSEAESGTDRRVGAGPLLLVAIAVAALAVAIGVRRREQPTLEPPF